MRTKWAICAAPLIRLPISTMGETEAVLMEDWTVEILRKDSVLAFTVPAGATTDGASIPRFLWRLCGHPLMAPRVYAALLHDWLYAGVGEPRYEWEDAPYSVDRSEADDCYYRLLRHFGIGSFVAHVEWSALRVFGGSHWDEDAHNPDDEEDDQFPAGAGNAGGGKAN
jgi:hypothetical protein